MAETNFAIELDEKKGRVLVAKRSLQQGELILHEKPLGKKAFFLRKISHFFHFFTKLCQGRRPTLILELQLA